jgi:hypothetical protein
VEGQRALWLTPTITPCGPIGRRYGVVGADEVGGMHRSPERQVLWVQQSTWPDVAFLVGAFVAAGAGGFVSAKRGRPMISPGSCTEVAGPASSPRRDSGPPPASIPAPRRSARSPTPLHRPRCPRARLPRRTRLRRRDRPWRRWPVSMAPDGSSRSPVRRRRPRRFSTWPGGPTRSARTGVRRSAASRRPNGLRTGGPTAPALRGFRPGCWVQSVGARCLDRHSR